MKLRKSLCVLMVVTLLGVMFAGCKQEEKGEEIPSTSEQNGEEVPSTSEEKGDDVSSNYVDKIFDTSYVHTIDITIDKGDLDAIYESPMDKTKYSADITIDGETVKNSSIATKGAESLRNVAADENSIRYSYKINFDKYVEGQTYYGLDQLILQNNVYDPSSLKSFIAFHMFNQMGVAAPLTSFAVVTINGENPSLYTIMEGPKDSFMDRNGLSDAKIYKPNWTEEIIGEDEEHDRNLIEEFIECTMVDNGIYLKYSDDEISSYKDIFENAVNDVNDEDKKRLIAALKVLSEGKNLESALDVDEIIAYFAVHNFIENYDSYIGGLCHNYLVCERNGIVSMLPWDYDRGFAPFMCWGGISSTDFVNQGIDTPLMFCAIEDRPMWAWIQSNEEYRAKYHEAMAKLAQYCEGDLLKLISEQYDMIRPYIAEDKTTSFKIEECDEAAKTVKLFVENRAKSVKKQVEGNLSTDSEEQKLDDRINCDDVDWLKSTYGLENAAGF